MSGYRTQIEPLLEGIRQELENANDIASMESISFDGTKATYDRLMQMYFMHHGVKAMTPEGITELCGKWYEFTKDGWDGYTTFAAPAESAVSTGTKGGSNVGKTCAPSTDATAGTDDYAGLPLFACKNVNYTVDPDTLDILITAIEGITDNYIQTDPTKFVGVMQMTGWHYYYEDSVSYTHGYADHRVDVEHCAPLPEAIRVDGSIRPFVVHSKYMSKTVNGKLTSCAGQIPTASISHNGLHSLSAATGAQYSGATTADDAFLYLMTYIKYASLTLDGIMQGCCSYDKQAFAQVSEEGVKRIILPSNCGILPHSSVLIGTYNGSSKDRGTAANYDISTYAGCIVQSVEDITIEGTSYKAVYVEIDEVFDTVANGDNVSGSTIVSSWHWRTGITDSVKGNDGSPVSNTSGAYPFKIQGIECMSGGYEVLADIIINLAAEDGVSYATPHVVNRSANQKSSITADYKALTALKHLLPDAAGWGYIKKMEYAEGVFFPGETGGSSSTYTKDAAYFEAQGTTGTRESLRFGRLYAGSGNAGLSCLNASGGLSNSGWNYLGRLSPNGNRGEWAA